MFTLEAIVTVVVVALVAGLGGYYTAFKFYRSSYSATDTSGDFGGPRGGVFALGMGCIFGMLLSLLASKVGLISGAAVGPGFITAMVVGLVSGILGCIRGGKARLEDEKNKNGGSGK